MTSLDEFTLKELDSSLEASCGAIATAIEANTVELENLYTVLTEINKSIGAIALNIEKGQ